jgi:hypothetical protein
MQLELSKKFLYMLQIWDAYLLQSEQNLAPDSNDKGLIFMKDRDILLTGDKWTLAVNIALDEYLALIRSMRFILVQIQRNIGKYHSPDEEPLIFNGMR